MFTRIRQRWSIRKLQAMKVAIFFLDMSYRSVLRKIDKQKEKMETLLHDNDLHRNVTSIYEDQRHWFYRHFLYMVAFVDFSLSYVVLADYTEFIPYVPTVVKCALIAVTLVWIELTLSLFKIKLRPEAADETHQQISKQDVVDGVLTLCSLIFISVLPAMAYSEALGQIGAEKLWLSLEGGVDTEAVATTIKQIKLKYIALGTCSFILHLFVISKPEHILSGMTRFKVKELYEELNEGKEQLEEEKTQMESELIAVLIKFDHAIQMHYMKFGNVEGIPAPRFSRPVNMLWRDVTGQNDEPQSPPESNTSDSETQRHEAT